MYNLEKMNDDLDEFRNIFLVKNSVHHPYTQISSEFSNPVDLTNKFYQQLVKTFSDYDCDKEIIKDFICCGVTDESLMMNVILKKFIEQAKFDDFKAVVGAFEKLLNTENIFGTTNLYRTLLLKGVGTSELKKKKEKIDYIINSDILNRNDNLCDIKSNEVAKNLPRSNFDDNLTQHYSRYIPFSWQLLSLFSNNPKAINSIYPDKVCNNIVIGYCHQEIDQKLVLVKNININKLQPEIIIKKYGKGFLTAFQEDLESGKLKDMINEIISNSLSIDEQKKMILQPLMALNIKNYQQMKKRYPEGFELIEKDDLEMVRLRPEDLYQFIDIEEEQLNIIKKYNLQNYETNNMTQRARENSWSIIMQERILKEKKDIKKSLNPSKKTKITKRRI